MATNNVQSFCRALWRHDDPTVAALAARVDPNGKDRWGNTPLLMSAQYGDVAIVSLLLKRGADVDQGRQYLTPIALAARRGAADIVEVLRGKGAKPSIVTSIYLGDSKQVRRDVKLHPAQALVRDDAGTPILHHAVEALQVDLVRLLLRHGATVADVDVNGETPLHRVADMRRAPQEPARRMAMFLLDRGADPNARNWDHVTPLHQAVRARNLAVVEVLLARGADPNARDKSRGSTPLRRAVSATGAGGTAGTAEMMVPLTRILLKYGADPDARDKRGVTVRASARVPEVLALLVEHRRTARAAKKKRGPADKAKRKAARSRRPKP